MNRTAIILIVCIIVLGALLVGWMFQERTIFTSESPDGKYMVSVLKRNFECLPVMPGHGSDVKCSIELRTYDEGRLLLRDNVDMLQNIEQIRWETDKVWFNSRCAIRYDGAKIGSW